MLPLIDVYPSNAIELFSMSKSNNPFKDLIIDRTKMQSTVCGLGATNYNYQKAGNTFQMSFNLAGVAVKIAVYENKDGTTTLSKLATPDETFLTVATAIAKACKVGDGGKTEFSIPRFGETRFAGLLEYLQEEKASIERDGSENGYRQVKLKSTQGDLLTFKLYTNGTLQMQGRSGILTAMAFDYLGSVLGYAEAVKNQLELYAVPVVLTQVRDEVEGRLPLAYPRVNEVVKKQLSTAVAVSKVNIELPDYGPIAFPALKGLEGFMKAELKVAGLDPDKAGTFGEYFEKSTCGTKHIMREPAATHVGAQRASIFANCYTIWSDERHGVAHVGTAEHSTRILPDVANAHAIIKKVFDVIEDTCSKLPK